MNFTADISILLVEDDDSLRVTQVMYLEREGFEVTAVGSGGGVPYPGWRCGQLRALWPGGGGFAGDTYPSLTAQSNIA